MLERSKNRTLQLKSPGGANFQVSRRKVIVQMKSHENFAREDLQEE